MAMTTYRPRGNPLETVSPAIYKLQAEDGRSFEIYGYEDAKGWTGYRTDDPTKLVIIFPKLVHQSV